MYGLGTIINVAAIVIGGLFGTLFEKLLKEHVQETLMKVCGLGTMFIAIAGAMEGMLSIVDGGITSGRAMLVVGCLALGALVGELLNIEDLFERFGAWLKKKTGNSGDHEFVQAFVTASLTVCIGAMAIVGAIEDGITGDYSILATKAVLDLIIVMVMASSLGKGTIFSAVPIAIWQGGITVLAGFMRPIMTAAALSNLSLVGSLLIFCVGVNLFFGKQIRVANLLPAVFLAVGAAFLPL